MFRERSEIISYTKDDIERICRYMAQQHIIGHMFIGKFGEQEVRWRPDGGVEVITKYVQGGWEDVPQYAGDEQLALPKRKKKDK
jgi:hypothetical protein